MKLVPYSRLIDEKWNLQFHLHTVLEKEVCKDEYKDKKEEPPAHPRVNEFQPLKKGDCFDVITLLSTNGKFPLIRVGDRMTSFVKAERLRGKNILLCSLLIPVNCPLHTFSLLSSELLSEPHKFQTEIVIVPKMRQGFDPEFTALDELYFSHLPHGCLSVPFPESKLRDSISPWLKYDDGKLSTIFIDVQNIVLQNDIYFISKFGARGFPFSDDKFNFLCNEFEDEYVPFSYLDEFLFCPPSFRLFGLSDPQISTTLDQLRNKLVGLYMLRSGDKFNYILDVYHQCREQGIGFEIVLVSLPFSEHIHPEKLQSIVNDTIKNMNFDTSGWWFFPYKNSSSMKLWYVAQTNTLHSDSMFIVDPANKIIDFEGGKAVRDFGIPGYPFTRQSLINQYVKKKEKVTLETFLTHGSIDSVYRRNSDDYIERVPVANLQGKNVLVCWDYGTSLFDEAVELFAEIKKLDPDIELVNILCGRNGTGCIKEYGPEVQWLERPYDKNYVNYLINHKAFVKSRGPSGTTPYTGLRLDSLLAFRKDGHIHSISASDLVNNSGLENCIPFSRENSDLHDEVIREIGSHYGYMIRMLNR